ncbi:MAG: ABC transporter ATP-binding protein [Anaerolineales bacterium]|nr:ABC transporter ATP-binding protein [Anaerolineales bacterium]MCB8953716.1 ABC transporter ATP-binding protein [Ardenticatenales bacterium]
MTDSHLTGGPVSPHPILSAQNLRKAYGNVPALRALSFTLQHGRILGFLGPNGAGKTTAIRILTTILEPTSGEFTIAGISSQHPDLIRRKIGVLPESLGLPRQMTATEFLVYFGQHYGYSVAAAKANAAALLTEVGLAQRANALIGSYSRGMRQRLGIARALVNDPVVVFLDEPTLGLDPRGKQELLELVRRIARQRQAAVVLCSHLLTEVEEVCDDVVILRQGQVVAHGSVTEVMQNAHQGLARLHVPAEARARARQQLTALPQVSHVSEANGRSEWLNVHLRDDGESHDLNPLLAALIQAQIPVLSFEGENGRLQDVFFQLTEEAIP